MSAHTPGPWLVKGWSRDDGQGDLQVGAERCGPGCISALVVSQGDTPGAFSEQDANARLIAAAPELLEACRSVVEDGFLDRPSIHACMAAIAKAEGKR